MGQFFDRNPRPPVPKGAWSGRGPSRMEILAWRAPAAGGRAAGPHAMANFLIKLWSKFDSNFDQTAMASPISRDIVAMACNDKLQWLQW